MSSYVSTTSITDCRNIIVTPRGHLSPRTIEARQELQRYIKRHFKNPNYKDRRTKAHRWMKFHDSEFDRDGEEK